MSDDALDLVSGTWEMAQALVDTQVGSFIAADAVEKGAIRHLLEVHEWDYPPGYDIAAAKACGCRELVAPSSTYLTWALPPYWAPGDPPIRDRVIPPLPFRTVPGEGTMMVATDIAVTFLQPIYVGDSINSTYWLRAVVPKSTHVGEGAFLTFEATFSNQDDQVVAVERTTTFRYTPCSSEEVAGTTRQSRSSSDATRQDGAEFVVGPTELRLTLQRLVMAAGSNRDFAPVHHDVSLAQGARMGAPFANSMFVGTHLERAATEWAGWHSRPKSLEFRLLQPARAGSTMVALGWATTALADPAHEGETDQKYEVDCHLNVFCDEEESASGRVGLALTGAQLARLRNGAADKSRADGA
jgi:3-methylfumaryl-CoA hydratase